MPPQMAEATRQVGREVERPKASDVAKQIRTECQALGRSCSLRQAKRLIRMLRRATAHEMLQQLLLDGREFALVHTRDGADQCVVAVRTAIV